MQFIKLFGKKNYEDNTYHSLNEVNTRGKSQPLFITKDDRKKYLVKLPERDVASCNTFMNEYALRNIYKATEEYKKLKTELSLQFSQEEAVTKILNDKAIDLMDKLLEDYDENEFRAGLEIFCAEFIRATDSNSAPRYRPFRKISSDQLIDAATESADEENFPTEEGQFDDEILRTENAPEGSILVGSRFIEDYKDACDCYMPGDTTTPATINGNIIIDDAYVLIEGTEKTKPIVGLGICAVLRYLISSVDCTTSNWGFIETADAFRICLLDFGGCLFTPTHFKPAIPEELSDSNNKDLADCQQLLQQNPNNLLKIVFENYNSKSDTSSPATWANLPESVYQSERVRLEILSTIDQLKDFSDENLQQLLNAHLENFPHHHELLINEIKAGVQFLSMTLEKELSVLHSTREESKPKRQRL